MIGLEGATCNTALIPEMEEIGANILLAEHIGRALVVGSEPADRLDVDVPGPPASRQAACRRSYADATGSWSFSVRVQTPGPLSRHRPDTPAQS